MSHRTPLCVAFLVTLALSSIASASASAEPTLPNILPLAGPKTILEGTVSTGANELDIDETDFHGVSGTGTFSANATKLGSFKELYSGFAGPDDEECSNSKTAGDVLWTGTFHIRDYKNSAKELKTTMIRLLNPVLIECEASNIELELKGCVAGALAPEGKLTKTLTLSLSNVGALNVESIKTVLNEANTAEEICELLAALHGGVFEQVAWDQRSTLSEFKVNGSATEVLVMPL